MIKSAQGGKEVVVWGQRARTLALCVLALLVAASFGLLLGVGPAHANTFTVNSTGDAGDNEVGNGSCFTGTSVQVGPRFEQECTLRAAIEEANVNAQSDTINFLSGLSGTITLTRGELVIADDTSATTEDLIIQGPGARQMAVSGNDASRVFSINSLVDVTISGLTIRDGYTDAPGGGIFNDGTLRLTNSTISGNSITSYSPGGGIFNDGTLTLTNSTISGNSAYYGGGVYNYIETLTVTNSTISGNSSDGEGGGIYNVSGTATLTNTILAGNSASTKPDASGSFTSEGYNLIGNTIGSSGWVASDLKNVNPLLGPLQDNGGPTKTHALLVGSPALNAIPSGTNGCGTTITTDQRGVGRPQSGRCEIGSFEDISPKVTRVVPQEDATGIGAAAYVSAVFSEPMRARTINTNTVKLFRAGTTTALSATITYDASTKKAVLNPSANLQLGSRYKAVVSSGAKDKAGNALDQNQNPSDGNQPKVWFFRVRT